MQNRDARKVTTKTHFGASEGNTNRHTASGCSVESSALLKWAKMVIYISKRKSFWSAFAFVCLNLKQTNEIHSAGSCLHIHKRFHIQFLFSFESIAHRYDFEMWIRMRMRLKCKFHGIQCNPNAISICKWSEEGHDFFVSTNEWK